MGECLQTTLSFIQTGGSDILHIPSILLVPLLSTDPLRSCHTLGGSLRIRNPSMSVPPVLGNPALSRSVCCFLSVLVVLSFLDGIALCFLERRLSDINSSLISPRAWCIQNVNSRTQLLGHLYSLMISLCPDHQNQLMPQ